MAMEMVKHFPTLLPQNRECTQYKGFLNIKGEQVFVDVCIDPEPSLSGCEKLLKLLEDQDDALNQIFCQPTTMYKMISELKSLLDSMQESASHELPNAEHINLLQRLDAIGWEVVEELSDLLNNFTLTTKDEKGREFRLKVNIPERFPLEALSLTADLPKTETWLQVETCDIEDVYEKFLLSVQKYQVLWDILDDIDERAWVLDPETPTRSCLYRRIVIEVSGVNMSVMVMLSPLDPHGKPEIQFLGPEYLVLPLKEKQKYLEQSWDKNLDFLLNLEEKLGVKIVEPSQAENEELSQDCGICYTYRLEDVVPDIVCNDARCARPYHTDCLRKWLISEDSKNKSSTEVTGKCPYCEADIILKIGD